MGDNEELSVDQETVDQKVDQPGIGDEPQPQNSIRIRQGPLSPASQGRKPVHRAKGLAAHRNPLRPMRTYLLLGNLHRSCRHLLDMINES